MDTAELPTPLPHIDLSEFFTEIEFWSPEMNPDPDYWIQTCYLDGHSPTAPFIGSYENAEERCAQLIAKDTLKFIDFVLLLSGDYRPGAVATMRQILADFQSYNIVGAKKWKK